MSTHGTKYLYNQHWNRVTHIYPMLYRHPPSYQNPPCPKQLLSTILVILNDWDQLMQHWKAAVLGLLQKYIKIPNLDIKKSNQQYKSWAIKVKLFFFWYAHNKTQNLIFSSNLIKLGLLYWKKKRKSFKMIQTDNIEKML